MNMSVNRKKIEKGEQRNCNRDSVPAAVFAGPPPSSAGPRVSKGGCGSEEKGISRPEFPDRALFPPDSKVRKGGNREGKKLSATTCRTGSRLARKSEIEGFEVPERVLKMLDILQEGGYPAYLVGGCVRDCLLGRRPNDWDICTSASPLQIKSLFKAMGYGVVPTGLKHGTVMVIDQGVPYEITVFRRKTQLYASDSLEKNEKEELSSQSGGSLEEDLSLRDFTINSMAWSPDRGLMDFYDGRADIKARLLRSKGSAFDRISEDPLRILRALRFSARIGFDIHPELKEAILARTSLLRQVAVERITSELYSFMQAPGTRIAPLLREYTEVFCFLMPELRPMLGFDQCNPHHVYDVWEHTMKAMEACRADDDVVLKFTVLFHDMGKPHAFTVDNQGIGHFYGHAVYSCHLCKEITRRLRFDSKTAAEVNTLVEVHDARVEPTTKSIRRWLNRLGLEQFKRLLAMKRCDAAGQNPAYWPDREAYIGALERGLAEILEQEACFSLKDLAVKGSDLIAVGYEKGSLLGKCLNRLLDEVLDERLPNEKEVLLAKAVSWLSQSSRIPE